MEDIKQWREELGMLHQQAETSLLIVDTMSGKLVDSICRVLHRALRKGISPPPPPNEDQI